MNIISKKHLFCLIVLLTCFFAQMEAQDQSITLKGKIDNFPDKQLTFRYQPYTVFSSLQTETAEVTENGLFSLSFKAEAPIRGFFSLGKIPLTETFTFTTVDGKDSTQSTSTFDSRLVFVYMHPGEELYVTVNADEYKTTLHFEGDNTSDSYFMNYEDQLFNQYKDRVIKNYYSIVAYDPHEFLTLVNKTRDEKLKFLSTQEKYDISSDLKRIFEWNYKGEAVTKKLYYPSSRTSYREEETVLPDDYFDFMDDVEVADDSGNLGVSYFYFLDAYLHKKFEMAGANESYYDYVATVLNRKAQYEYYAFALKRDFKKPLYDKFGPDCPYPELAAKVKKAYKHLEGMLEGNPAPNVVLTDTTGNSIPLSSMKGSYVYLDFWATWCGPCIKEIPSLKALERSYEDKNISFVSISFDDEEDLDKWKNFINRRNLSGTQLWVDAKNKAMFSEAFNIVEIPRFVLIDREGNIIDANAQRPSDDQIRKVLDNLDGI